MYYEADNGRTPLTSAIVRAVVYADLFDYPMTLAQIHRFLIGCRATRGEVEERLQGGHWLRRRVESAGGYWFLAGRRELVGLRNEREGYARRLWPAAWRYGRLIAGLPFVRLVAVTGSLSMNNVMAPHDDIDLLVVTRTGRLWLARGLTILVVRAARIAGIQICPNYFISESTLQIHDPGLFTAHELAQTVPLYGLQHYEQLLACNRWLMDYLPNAGCLNAGRDVGKVGRYEQRFAEQLLAAALGDAVERWERERKIARLRRQALGDAGETVFGPDLCKGHMQAHAQWVTQRYAARLEEQGV